MEVYNSVPQPVVVCRKCFNSIPLGLIRQLFILRHHLTTLMHKFESLVRNQELGM